MGVRVPCAPSGSAHGANGSRSDNTKINFEKISPDDEYAKDRPKKVKEKIKDNITKRSKSTILLKYDNCVTNMIIHFVFCNETHVSI